jgi:tetratricopeptide (TPR) repeat protein
MEVLMKSLLFLIRRLIPAAAVMLWIGAGIAHAQEDESPVVTRYREDYEAYQKVVAISDPLKRGEQLIQFIKDRPKLDAKLLDTAQANLFTLLDGYIKTESNEPLLSLSERYIKVRPKAGQTYYCYGFALRNLKRYDEAMIALAKCYLIKNPVSEKARNFLDSVYKGQHRGSLAGEEQIISKAKQELPQ